MQERGAWNGLNRRSLRHDSKALLHVRPIRIGRELPGQPLDQRRNVLTCAQLPQTLQRLRADLAVAIADQPPPEVPIREGVIYFQLKIDDDNWKTVLDERNLAMFFPKPYGPGNVQFELLAIPPA